MELSQHIRSRLRLSPSNVIIPVLAFSAGALVMHIAHERMYDYLEYKQGLTEVMTGRQGVWPDHEKTELIDDAWYQREDTVILDNGDFTTTMEITLYRREWRDASPGDEIEPLGASYVVADVSGSCRDRTLTIDNYTSYAVAVDDVISRPDPYTPIPSSPVDFEFNPSANDTGLLADAFCKANFR